MRYRDITEEFIEPTQEDGYVYHGTARARLSAIRNQGLVPSSRSRFNRSVGVPHNWSVGKVFVCDTVRAANFYAREAAPTNRMILRIPRSAVADGVEDMHDREGSSYIERAIPPSQIEYWNGKQWKRVGKLTEAVNHQDVFDYVIKGVTSCVPEALEIWFHGSRARGDHRPKSDWDFIVVIPEESPIERYAELASNHSELHRIHGLADIQVCRPSDAKSTVSAFYFAKTEGEGRLIWQRPLNEAPIAYHELQGPVDQDDNQLPFNKGTGFSKSDQKLLQSERGMAKIYSAFERTPHTFEVFFVNSDHADGENHEDNYGVDEHARRIKSGVHDSCDDIMGKDGVIRVVLMGNLSPSDSKMPLTGWTLAHKVGHALQDHCYNFGWKNPWGSAMKRIMGWLVQLAEAQTGREPSEGPNAFFRMPDAIYQMLTMKSARTHKLENDFEVIAEIIAQYLVAGKVTMQSDSEAVPALTAALNREIAQMFDHLAGHVLIEI